MTSFSIRQLNHVALAVKDLEASTQFFEDVLGLAQIPRPAFSFPGAWFRIGPDQELHLIGGREAAASGSSRGNHFALAVSDARAAAAAFVRRGVAHRGPGARPDGALQIFLEDPDGNVVELCELPK